LALINPVIKCISLFREVRLELYRSGRSTIANFAIDPYAGFRNERDRGLGKESSYFYTFVETKFNERRIPREIVRYSVRPLTKHISDSSQ